MKIGTNGALVLVAMACLALAGASIGGWHYMENQRRSPSQPVAMDEAAKRTHYLREVRPHRLTVMGYANPIVNGRRSGSVPVMIKLVVSGWNGLKTVCGRLPHVKEAVLRILSPGGEAATDSAGRLDLAKIEPLLRQAINKAIQRDSVQSVTAVMLSSGGGQMTMGGAQGECKDALSLIPLRR